MSELLKLLEKQKSKKSEIVKPKNINTKSKNINTEGKNMHIPLPSVIPTFVEFAAGLKEIMNDDVTGVYKRLYKYSVTGRKHWKKIVEDSFQALISILKKKYPGATVNVAI